MRSFKVICKNDKDNWVKNPIPIKPVVVKYLFGLVKRTKIVSEDARAYGPSKDEICIVYGDYTFAGDHFYNLKGYSGGYISRAFIRLDEMQETQKEIAEKADCNKN